MRAAATRTTMPNTREEFCSAECRQQAAVPRGQSVGQLGSKDEKISKKTSGKIPKKILKSGLGSSRHPGPRSRTSRPRS